MIQPGRCSSVRTIFSRTLLLEVDGCNWGSEQMETETQRRGGGGGGHQTVEKCSAAATADKRAAVSPLYIPAYVTLALRSGRGGAATEMSGRLGGSNAQLRCRGNTRKAIIGAAVEETKGQRECQRGPLMTRDPLKPKSC